MTIVSVLRAGLVDINGGSSCAGWDFISNGQSFGVWVQGQTNRPFDTFSTQFNLEASQVVGGSRLADGAAGNGSDDTGYNAGNLTSGLWQVRARIIGVGVVDSRTGFSIHTGLGSPGPVYFSRNLCM